jgi:response regulator RpfG family c-di-GMP phosphodiesterase
MLISTPFTGLLYSIDENNIYTRGDYFFLSIIIEIVLYIDLIIYISVNKKELNKKDFTTIILFIIFPQIMQIIQLASYGVSLINTGYTMAFLIMFIESYNDLEENLNQAGNKIYAKNAELERSRQRIIEMQNHTIESLSNLVESRDESTGKHVRRTISYVEVLSSQLMQNGYFTDILTPGYILLLKRAAPMHDIGKIVVPDAILKKPGRLTHSEFLQMKRHASEGGRIVHEILDGYEDPEYIQITADIATHHHEKWNGTGYPGKLVGEAIPLSARIMAIADVFDALVSPRVYKSPMSYDEAFQIIEEGIGVHFDPVIAREFLNIKEKAAAINESYKGK